jgi:hypothetical protein
MPLDKSKSKQAFSKNVSTEMDAGKPQKQALAIAYATKRRNKKPKKYSTGGLLDSPEDLDKTGDMQPDSVDESMSHPTEMEVMNKRRATQDDDQWMQNPDSDDNIKENNETIRKKFANGGQIPDTREVEGDRRMLSTSPDADEPQESRANLSRGEGRPGVQPSDGISENADIVEAIMAKRAAKNAARFAEGGRITEAAGDTDSVFDAEDAFSGHGSVDANLKENLADDTDDSDHDHDLIGQILSDRKRKRG